MLQYNSVTENLSLKSMQVPDYDPNDSSHVLVFSLVQPSAELSPTAEITCMPHYTNAIK